MTLCLVFPFWKGSEQLWTPDLTIQEPLSFQGGDNPYLTLQTPGCLWASGDEWASKPQWNKADWGPRQCGDAAGHCFSSWLMDECLCEWRHGELVPAHGHLQVIGIAAWGVVFKQLSGPMCWDWLVMSAVELEKLQVQAMHWLLLAVSKWKCCGEVFGIFEDCLYT